MNYEIPYDLIQEYSREGINLMEYLPRVTLDYKNLNEECDCGQILERHYAGECCFPNPKIDYDV